jgi:type II secretory ATPase GspE/PulE/Tfp pilus assembly ATPase PilB-like protein
MAGLNQAQVRTDIGFTFANGLRGALRQDPDIIMV